MFAKNYGKSEKSYFGNSHSTLEPQGLVSPQGLPSPQGLLSPQGLPSPWVRSCSRTSMYANCKLINIFAVFRVTLLRRYSRLDVTIDAATWGVTMSFSKN